MERSPPHPINPGSPGSLLTPLDQAEVSFPSGPPEAALCQQTRGKRQAASPTPGPRTPPFLGWGLPRQGQHPLFSPLGRAPGPCCLWAPDWGATSPAQHIPQGVPGPGGPGCWGTQGSRGRRHGLSRMPDGFPAAAVVADPQKLQNRTGPGERTRRGCSSSPGLWQNPMSLQASPSQLEGGA